uniref:Uncharacterized protein n=1 Tax=Siphoviridae sp. ctBLh2 TaxID=2827803 RepID=A0A8S5S3H7_9CAUD|nr:MAG TPA: hypothetical protein [Siphoviridae sp. ctBLh2]
MIPRQQGDAACDPLAGRSSGCCGMPGSCPRLPRSALFCGLPCLGGLPV